MYSFPSVCSRRELPLPSGRSSSLLLVLLGFLRVCFQACACPGEFFIPLLFPFKAVLRLIASWPIRPCSSPSPVSFPNWDFWTLLLLCCQQLFCFVFFTNFWLLPDHTRGAKMLGVSCQPIHNPCEQLIWKNLFAIVSHTARASVAKLHSIHSPPGRNPKSSTRTVPRSN